ncbi:PAP2-domain-containing protein [Lactarius akahatsu]|uniref:PAP2-domain-containing protein n=1 Tax=Lactarius akahatsu TaxID=416441 RepID=A0AAD4LVA4_9AGAM|nr:PAP2-domain-containing protein [Lactarius akahatsu]
MPSFFRNAGSPSYGHRTKLLISYAPDWILTIALSVAFYLLDKVDGFKREFSVSDTSLRHPYAIHERVPNTSLYVIAFVAPLVLQWVINLLTTRSLWDAHNSALGLVLSLSLAGAFTQVVKVTVGRPRPDIIDRCQPNAGTVDPPFGLSSAAICHQSDRHILNDGFRSFPSGHSSLSFAGLTFLSLYIAGKLLLFDSRGHAPKVWLSVLPLFGAALVAVSRTMDYRHHWQDVVAGSCLGILTAYFSYRLYYPSLSSEVAQLPFSPRIHRLDASLPSHVHPEDSPYYHRHTGSDAEVELLQGTARRDDPAPLDQAWKQGPSVESGLSR